jgi:uncharacterized membrane protein YcaP (DUF421 family)
MAYVSLFDPIPWPAVGNSVVQTFILYWFVLLGIKKVGRRVFSEMSPQDVVVLVMVAEACNLGLSDERAGFWGTIASVLTLFITGGLVERIKPLNKLLEEDPITLFENGQLNKPALKKNLVNENDLQQVAHQYGIAHYSQFTCMTLEGDGSITGVLPPVQARQQQHADKPTAC